MARAVVTAAIECYDASRLLAGFEEKARPGERRMSAAKIRNTELDRSEGPALIRRLSQAALYPVFGLLLLIPLVRRWRRSDQWRKVRRIAVGLGVMLILAGGAGAFLTPVGAVTPAWVAVGAGVVMTLLGALWEQLEDPDALRKRAARFGALHTLNGGFFLSGDATLAPQTPLLLFLTEADMLLIPARDAGRATKETAWRRPIEEIAAIEFEGRAYEPFPGSHAKAPVVREEKAGTNQTSRLAIGFSASPNRPNSRLELEYRGSFARHLAEVAAHTLYQMRRGPAESGAKLLPILEGRSR